MLICGNVVRGICVNVGVVRDAVSVSVAVVMVAVSVSVCSGCPC